MQLVKWMKENYPEIIKSMKDCSHDLSLTQVSPYHGEGDVYTHTLMVYNPLKNKSWELRLAAFLHDIGKPPTQTVKEGREYYSFTCHEHVSTHMAIDILLKFEKDFNITLDKEMILKSIDYHQDIHKLGRLNDAGEYELTQEELTFINHKFGNFEFYSFMIELSAADAHGRLCIDSRKLEKQYEFLFNYIPTEPYKDMKELESRPVAIMLAGAPGSGKSEIAKELMKDKSKNYIYLCNDSIVMEGNKKNVPYGMFWTPKKLTEAIKILDERLEVAITERQNIIIDGTNIDQIARIRRLGKIPDKYYYKKAINVLASKETLLARNNERKKDMRDLPEKYVLFNLKEFELIGEDVVHHSSVVIST